VEIRDDAAVDVRLYRVTFQPDSAGGKPVGRIVVAEERATVAMPRDEIINHSAASDTEHYPAMDEFTMVEHAPMYDMADLQHRLVYPAEAARNNIAGLVIVRALIDRHGRVVKTHIDRCDHPLLQQAAVDAIVGTIFTPAISEGKPVAVWMQMPVTFKLSGH
jgi:TonB family protein